MAGMQELSLKKKKVILQVFATSHSLASSYIEEQVLSFFTRHHVYAFLPSELLACLNKN